MVNAPLDSARFFSAWGSLKPGRSTQPKALCTSNRIFATRRHCENFVCSYVSSARLKLDTLLYTTNEINPRAKMPWKSSDLSLQTCATDIVKMCLGTSERYTRKYS